MDVLKTMVINVRQKIEKMGSRWMMTKDSLSSLEIKLTKSGKMLTWDHRKCVMKGILEVAREEM